MNMRLPAIFAALVGLTFVLAGCNERRDGWQGWIEANLIFVAPDEVGRVQTLSVREGDVVKAGDPLFTVDDDLQRPISPRSRRRSPTRSRPTTAPRCCSRSGAGTQKDFDAAAVGPARCPGAAELVADAAARRAVFSPVSRHRPADLFPSRRNGARPGGRCCRCCRLAT